MTSMTAVFNESHPFKYNWESTTTAFITQIGEMFSSLSLSLSESKLTQITFFLPLVGRSFKTVNTVIAGSPGACCVQLALCDFCSGNLCFVRFLFWSSYSEPLVLTTLPGPFADPLPWAVGCLRQS